MSDLEQRIEAARGIVRHGGQLIFENFHTSIAKREKSRHDYVTEIDLKIENLVDTEVKQLFPDDAILGEENEEISGTSGYMWVVDPLDGTNNFVKGIPQAGIQLAIYKGDEILYAAILNPFVHQLYEAQKGHGASVQDLLSNYSVDLRVADNKLSESLVIYDAGIAKGESPAKEIFLSLLGNIGWIRIFGVAVLDLPLVALGSADLLISNIPKPMDIAPGCLLIEEAGGIVTDFLGQPWSLRSKNIVAGTAANHATALTLIQSAATA